MYDFETVPFKAVLYDAAGMAGLVSEDETIRDDVAAAFTRWINKWTRRAWQAFPWPDLIATEERRWRATWSNTEAYLEGDEVSREVSGVWLYYRALGSTTLGAAPEATPLEWEAVTDYRRVIARNQAGLARMGAIVAIWDRDPHTVRCARQVEYRLAGHGILFGTPFATESVWIQYRLLPSQFTVRLWDEEETVVENEVRYAVDDGNCYRALTPTHGDYPPLAPDRWQLVPLPAIFAPYVAQCAYSDWLREDGQHEKAAPELAIGGELLKDAMQQIVITQGQSARYSVET